MPPAAKPALQNEPNATSESPSRNTIRRVPNAPRTEMPPRLPNALSVAEHQARPVTAQPLAKNRQTSFNFQPRIPVLQGEATYRGSMPVDGIISGQLGAACSALTIKQRPKNGVVESVPELDGEITFKDMLRINGHIAGKVFSEKGTLIIDASARVDASIDVAVAVISGTVHGDVTGHQRVEVGLGAVVRGNIATRSLALRPGAVFEGDCRIIKDESGDR